MQIFLRVQDKTNHSNCKTISFFLVVVPAEVVSQPGRGHRQQQHPVRQRGRLRDACESEMATKIRRKCGIRDKYCRASIGGGGSSNNSRKSGGRPGRVRRAPLTTSWTWRRATTMSDSGEWIQSGTGGAGSLNRDKCKMRFSVKIPV